MVKEDRPAKRFRAKIKKQRNRQTGPFKGSKGVPKVWRV